jgi:hypothetical protein
MVSLFLTDECRHSLTLPDVSRIYRILIVDGYQRATPNPLTILEGMGFYDPERTINDFLISLEGCTAFFPLYCISDEQTWTILIMERSQLLQKFSGWISRLSACFGSYHNRSKHSNNSQNQYPFSSITCHCLLFRKSDLSYPRRSRRLVNPDDVLVERPEAVLVHGQQRTYHLPFCYLTYMYPQPLQPPLSSTSLIHLRTPRSINNNHN